MSNDIVGTLHVVQPTQQISDNFKKREFILKVVTNHNEKQYEEYLKFELIQDNVLKLDKFKQGQTVSVSYNLRGREYIKDGKAMYFNTLQAWRIAAQENTSVNAPAEVKTNVESDDDLPF